MPCDPVAGATDLDAAGELETTTAEDEMVIFFCADTNPAAAKPRTNKAAIALPARHMRIFSACRLNVRGVLYHP